MAGIIGIVYFVKNHRHPADNTRMVYIKSSPRKHLESVKDLYKIKTKVTGVLPVDDEETLEQIYDRTYSWGKRSRLPHAVVIGAQGCGTKPLVFYMQSHPDVVVNLNDVNFFAMDFLYDMGYNWYRLRMPPSEEGQLVLSRGSFNWDTVGVPERIYAMKKDVKLIVAICDPTRRVLKWYENEILMAKEREENSPLLEQIVFDHKNKSLISNHRIIKGGKFSENYKRWLQFFKPEQFFFVNGTNLNRNPVAEIYKLEEFLKLEHRLTSEFVIVANGTHGPCRKTIEGNIECMKPYAKTRTDLNLTIDTSTLSRLKTYFGGHNKNFFEMTGLNVSNV